MKNTFYLVIFLFVLAGCKEEMKEAAVEETVTTEMAARSETAHAPLMADKTAETTQKIIKNANLRFETEDLAATAAIVNKAIAKYGAQTQSDVEGSQSYELNRIMEIRVPSRNFEAFVNDIGKGVKYFDRKEISSEDVTEQYIDTEARIKAKKVLEARYLELISKAKKVSEVLEIEKELSAIREEIEAKEGQLRYMKSRVAMSTVKVEFYKRLAESPDATVSYGSKIWNAIVSGFNGLSSFFIILLNIWPLILIFVIGFIIIRKKLKKGNNHV